MPDENFLKTVEDENAKLLAALGGDVKVKQEKIQDSLVEAVKIKEPFTKVGDIWQLGKHKLAVGSSADRTLLEKLIDGEKVDFIFTDPPYDMPNELLLQIFRNAEDLADLQFWMMSDRQAIYLCSREFKYFRRFFIHDFIQATEEPGGQLFTRKTLIAQFGNRDTHNLRDGFCDIIAIGTLRTTREHKTFGMGKRPELPETFIRHFHQSGIIFDCFGGSGSTLIAAENCGKTCYLIELEPLYASIIIQRWAYYTGLEPKLVSSLNAPTTTS